MTSLGVVWLGSAVVIGAFRHPGRQSGMRCGTATGGLIATYMVVDAYSVRALGVAPVVLDWFSNLPRFFLLAPLVSANLRRAIEAMRICWWIAVGVSVLSPLSYILVLAALSSGAPLRLIAHAPNVDGGRCAQRNPLRSSCGNPSPPPSSTLPHDLLHLAGAESPVPRASRNGRRSASRFWSQSRGGYSERP